jgi:hypothetical protein
MANVTEQTRRPSGLAWLAVAGSLVSAVAGCREQVRHADGGSLGSVGGTIMDPGPGSGGRAGNDALAGDGGFASDFVGRAGAALAAGAPSWTCATTLPTVPVADGNAAREVIRAFVAAVVGVPAGDVTVTDGACGVTMPTTCATRFAHDCAKSGGAIYDTVVPLANELEANADLVEETIWVPLGMTGDVVMSGISDGLLVGMVVFNGTYACR